VWKLSIAASSVLNAGTNILKVAGNFSSNGNFVVSAGGTLELNGIAAQSIDGTSNPLSLENLTISNIGNSFTTRDLNLNGDFVNSMLMENVNTISC
jgi:hypothetical protein